MCCTPVHNKPKHQNLFMFLKKYFAPRLITDLFTVYFRTTSDYVAPSTRKNAELERIWKEVVMFYLRYYNPKLLEWNKEIQ
jgi:hypothetical protein